MLKFYEALGFENAVYKENTEHCTSMVVTSGNPAVKFPHNRFLVAGYKFSTDDTGELTDPQCVRIRRRLSRSRARAWVRTMPTRC